MNARTLAGIALAVALLAFPIAAQQHPSLERGLSPGKAYEIGEIDAVNEYNGALTIAIPIGPTYTVGGSFSYSVTLYYSSAFWDTWIDQVQDCNPPYSDIKMLRADPVLGNAGLGWNLGFGGLKVIGFTGTDLDRWVYVSPDGGEHLFYGTLHTGETQTQYMKYTRDGMYLRLKYSNYGSCNTSYTGYLDATVESPDGTIRTFHRATACDSFLLTSIADHFNNSLSFAYSTNLWTLTDSQGRHHYVNFASGRVSSVDLEAFDDPSTQSEERATYQFTYDASEAISRSCKEEKSTSCTGHNRGGVTVALLTGITLPDYSSWSMMNGSNPAYNLDRDGYCDALPSTGVKDRPGTLTKLTAPTGGTFEWTYSKWENPSGSDTCYFDSKERGAVLESAGVATRTVTDPLSGTNGQWQYFHDSYRTGGVIDASAQESWTVIRSPSPEIDDTKHFFRTRYCLQNTPTQEGWDYGLPYTRGRDGTGGSPYTSVEYYDGAFDTGTLKRTSYLTYDHDTLYTGTGYMPADWQNSDRRGNYQKTAYADDGNKWADVAYSTYDGLGHYRSTITNGNFSAGNARGAWTNFNSSAGTYPGSFTLPSTTAPWILGTYDYQTQTEATITARQEFCFDSTNGFLKRTRTLTSGITPGASDLLSVFTNDSSGNVTREQHYGGDAQSVGTGTLCSLTLPASDAYRVDHGYSYGTRNSSTYVQSNGTPYTFKSLDCDVDQSTGMYSACRDTSGIQTAFLYDTMGRPTWAKPESGQGAYLHNQYLSYGTCGGPKVETCTKANGTTTECVNTSQSCNPYSDSLTRSSMAFDGLGRIVGEYTKYDASNWNQRLTTYDGLGLRTSVSEWQPSGTSGTSIKSTVYSGFDPFGRPSTITPPDGTGHNITLACTGVRQVARTLKVFSDTGGTPASERDAVTTEEYDRQGRLYQVTESSGSSGANVTTTYAYDVGNRLHQVSATSGSTQTRTFTYDNRGFLTSEQLPELGVNGNGTIAYSNYDARGHALRKYDGQSYVKFELDRAERLWKVRESNSSWADVRVLRQFDYATANNGADKRNGKLLTATANNFISPNTYPVVETYTYAGVGGRVSRRQTTVDGRNIYFDLTWTDLGRPLSVAYPNDQAIGDPARKIINTYSLGFLSAVCEGTNPPPTCTTNYATSITYQPNLLVKAVAGANNATWTQQIADGLSGRPNDAMARPYSITVTGASSSWSLGPYQYDGAGNVKQIGTTSPYETYVYDKVLRLTSGTIVTGTPAANRTQTAQYDAFGFMTNLTTNGSGQTFNVVAGTNHVSGMCYNAAGSVIGWGGTCGSPPYTYNYSWDVLNQMASTYGSSFTKRTFLYTADGERIEERIGADPNSPTSSVIAARGLDGKVLRLFTNSGGWSWTKDYVYRDGVQLASIEPPIPTPVVRYFHLDHLGTIRRITDTSTPPVIIKAHDYYPFGFEATDPCQDTEKLKWTGQERDQQGTCSNQGDDLDYMHARYENFNTGRFLSVDPLRGNPKRPQSFNLFAYARNNPMNLVDPLGLEPQSADPKASGNVPMKSDGTCADESNSNDPDCAAYKQEHLPPPATPKIDPSPSGPPPSVGPQRPTQASTAAAEEAPIQAPDFLHASVTFVALTVEGAVDRNGNVYGTIISGSLGTTLLKKAPKFAFTLTAGLVMGEAPTPSNLRGFLEGNSMTRTLALWAATGRTTNLATGTEAKEAGFGTPQYTVNLSHMFFLGSVPVSW